MAVSYYLFSTFAFLTIFAARSEYSIKFETRENCNVKKTNYDRYYDMTHLKCLPCSQNNRVQSVSKDGLSCVCRRGFKYTKNLGQQNVICVKCADNQVTSEDGWDCINCNSSKGCLQCGSDNISADRELDGSRIEDGNNVSIQKCVQCLDKTFPNREKTQCVRCSQILDIFPDSSNCSCPRNQWYKGLCFRKSSDIKSSVSFYIQLNSNEVVVSSLLQQYLVVSHGMCQAKYRNLTACQTLANMCTLLFGSYYVRKINEVPHACTLYRNLTKLAKPPVIEHYDIKDWPYQMPWLYYTGQPLNVLSSQSLPVEFKVNPLTQMDFVVAMYSVDGHFLGLKSVKDGLLQLCKMAKHRMNAIWTFGTTYSSKCDISVTELFDNKNYPLVFFDLYLRYTYEGEKRLYAIPIVLENLIGEKNIRVNREDIKMWVLTRRFFLVDNIALKTTPKTGNENGYRNVRVAQSIKFIFRLQPSLNGLIYPPYVKIFYEDKSWRDAQDNKTISVVFNAEYQQDEGDIGTRIDITFSVLSCFAVLLAGFNTWVWSKRSARVSIDFASIVNLFLNLCAALGSVFFYIIIGIGGYFLLFFKLQNTVMVLPISSDSLKDKFSIFIIVAFVFKLFHVIQLLVRQCTMDVFFIDWEKPKSSQNEQNVSAWRTLFVANEWVELQAIRRVCTTIQVIALLVLLKVVGLERLTSNDANSTLIDTDTDSVIPQNQMFRFTLPAILYIFLAILQVLYQVIFHERYVQDMLQQFIDLCSLSNISVFMMDHLLHGYYIHGRSVHGKADTNFRGIQQMMSREQNDLCSERGLLPNSQNQSFEMSLPKKLRSKYIQIMMPITNKTGSNRMDSNLSNPTNSDYLQAHEVMNKYLSSFIDHSLKDTDYFVKDKTFLENVLNAEFTDTTTQGIFYTDNGHSFDRLLLFGHDILFIQFEILLFSVTDLICQNYILDASIVYIGHLIISLIRQGGSKKNIARKTLVDRRFLI
ncbi:meckelin [Argonauta hians]